VIHLEVDRLSFAWPGGAEVFQDISFSVRSGEFCAVVGPSGCGKTTLVRLIAGLERPTRGRVRVDRLSAERPLTTVVFQDHGVFPWMRVRDNVGYALEMRGVARDARKAIVDRWLEKTGLSRVGDAWPHTLSGGMRQRVAVARALANGPEVLLMDEPFAALDEQTRATLQTELLATWSETGSTVVFVTHSLSEAVVLADRIVVLSHGPARVRDIVDVPLERPRDPYRLRTVPAFGELVYRLYELLR
jgi:NitT/TauT family transport system ATP-binding protein